MFQFDWTLNVSTLMVAFGGLVTVFKIWLYQRDFNRDVLSMMGKKAPRDDRAGMLGDIADLKELGDIHTELIDSHHLALNLDRRHHARRIEPGAHGPT